MKTTLQKLTEKTLMLERNSEFTICVLKDCLVIGVGNVEFDNFSFTPIAKLLSHEDIVKLESSGIKFGWTACTNLLLEKAREDLKGTLPDDFKEDLEHPAFTQKSIDKYQKDIDESDVENKIQEVIGLN